MTVDGSTSAVRYQSTQQSGGSSQAHRPDFPVSPVPVLTESPKADTITPPEGAAVHLGLSGRHSAGNGNEKIVVDGREICGSTPKGSKQQSTGLCVGSYFSAGISPPLVMPSTSHIGGSPISPTDLHSPLHPPARPSSSTYTPLMKKTSARKLSPTRKSPSKAIQLPVMHSTPWSDGIKRRTHVDRERKETLEEEDRLAVLSGRQECRRSTENKDDVRSVTSEGTVQLGPHNLELDIEPVTMDETGKQMAEFRKAASEIEIIDVKMKDVSPKERKLQKCPTLEITALSPKKLSKFFSSRSHFNSSSESDADSLSTKSSQQLKKFSIGKKQNKLDVSLKILDKDVKGKKSAFAVPTHSKPKTPAKKKGDISVLFSSPDRYKKTISNQTSLSPDASVVRKRRKIKLYKESMLMPVNDDTSKNSESLGSSESQDIEVQSTPYSDVLLISNSSNETEFQKPQSKENSGKRPSEGDDNEVPPASKKRTKMNDGSVSNIVSDYSGEMVTPMTRDQRQKHKDQFLERLDSKLPANVAKKLEDSPIVKLPSLDQNEQVPSYSLTIGQRSKRMNRTPERDKVEETSQSDWDLPFTPLPSGTNSLVAASEKPSRAPQDVTSILMVSKFFKLRTTLGILLSKYCVILEGVKVA